MTIGLQDLLSRLDRVTGRPGQHMARCPAHEDAHASLSIGQGDDGRVLVHCQAGCPTEKVLVALSLTMADLMPLKTDARPRTKRQTPGRIVTTYPYRDEGGSVLFEVVRFDPKGFRQRRPDGNGGYIWNLDNVRRVLYRLPELLAADPAAWYFVTEGEKDAEAVARLGLAATTNPGGADKWKHLSDDTLLHGRPVCILVHKDPAGRAHALDVAARLHGKASDVRVLELPDASTGTVKDAWDWVEAHDAQSAEDLAAMLVEMAEKAPPWRPEADGGNGEAGSDPAPVLCCMADIVPQRVRWAWPGKFPLGKASLLFGDPGVAKSLVTMDVAARISTGTPWPDLPGERTAPGGVVILSAEDDPEDTIRPRLDAAGADPRRIFLLRGVKVGDSQNAAHFNLACDLPALEAAIRQTPDARLVIIDPISAYLGRTDSHRNSEVRGLLAPLADLAARYDVAVMAVSHLNKGGGERAMYRVTGSLAFVAAARAAWLVIVDADDANRRLFLPAKQNLTEEPNGLAFRVVPVTLDGIGPVARVEWERDPVRMRADDALAATASGEDRTAQSAAATWLRDALAGGALPQRDLVERAERDGIKTRTLYRAKDALGVVASKTGLAGGWTWRLS